jgi:hypothetical protein
MAQSETIGALALALSKAQGSMEAARKEAQNPHLRNKYADLTSCWDACREPLTQNGLAIVQTTETQGESITIITTLAHESGEWISGSLTIPATGNKGVNPAQALGSAISYGRRYGLTAIVGVCTDDDDGQASSKPRGNRTPPPLSITGPELDKKIDAAVSVEALTSLYHAHKDAWTEEHTGRASMRKEALRVKAELNATEMVSPAQMKALQTIFSNLGYDRDERLIEVENILGRKIASAKELTKEEAGKVLEKMGGQEAA